MISSGTIASATVGAGAVGCAGAVAGSPASHPTPIPPITLPAHHPVADLAKHIGQRVTMQGTLAAIPWQHMLSPPAGTQHHYYFNVGARQIVLYSKDELACKTTLEVTGTVLELAGAAQRGSPDGLKEYHLDVASWRCLP